MVQSLFFPNAWSIKYIHDCTLILCIPIHLSHSGSSSGDDFKRINDIVTPPQLSDDDTHLLPPLGSQQPGKATGSNGGLLSFNDDDLNKATDEYLAHKKEEMNMLYETNRIKPGDEGYVYDKEMDFDNEPKMESGWDSDDSMSDF